MGRKMRRAQDLFFFSLLFAWFLSLSSAFLGSRSGVFSPSPRAALQHNRPAAAVLLRQLLQHKSTYFCIILLFLEAIQGSQLASLGLSLLVLTPSFPPGDASSGDEPIFSYT